MQPKIAVAARNLTFCRRESYIHPVKDLIKRARSLLTPALVYHTDVAVKSASGVYVEGADGRRYLDFTSGLATTSLGHCHPRVVDAIKAQAGKLLHAGGIFHFEAIVELAERLRRITPGGIDKFFFSNSGAEAVDGAIKLARYFTGRQAVIAFTGSFHGRTLGAISLTASSAKYRRRYHPLLPGVYHVPYPFCYRCPVGQTAGNCSTECFRLVELTLAHLVSPDEIAAIIIEPVLGEGGYAVPPAEYLKKLHALCKRHGILFIADEVQSGMGRTGKWFGVEHFKITPDIITIAKGVAGGMPLSAIGASKEIMDSWVPGAHGTTFGGNPVSCAAACAVIDAVESDGLLESVRKNGDYALKRLREMKAKNHAIGDVRGLGHMIGVEIARPDGSPDPARLKKMLARCLRDGLVIVECGRDKNVARLMPPLIATAKDMARALDIFEGSLR
jgi:4-aminobutyrate aminotransferase